MDKTNFYDNQSGLSIYKPTDKINNINQLINNYLNKTLAMFEYINLPDSIPSVELEKILQLQGKAFIMKQDDKLVALDITLNNGKVDIYNNALEGMVFLPNKQRTENVKLDEGILISNDYLNLGLTEIFKKYSYLTNESSITLFMANFWKRTEKVFTANDSNTEESVKKYLKDTEEGKFSIVNSNLLYDSLQVENVTSTGTSLSELIEYDNYLKSAFYSEIGLYTNNNMKKERLITTEVETGLNAIYPLVDNMLMNRIEGINKVNEMFDLEIEVKFSSSWETLVSEEEEIEEIEEEEVEEEVEEEIEEKENEDE